MEGGITIPKAYILSRTAGPGLVQTAIAAFSITPLSCVIISEMKDHRLAMEFGELIVQTHNEADAVSFALESFANTHMPSLVIVKNMRGTFGIAALYEDGHLEDLPWQTADSLPS